MLLIDDDQAERSERQPERGPRADHDPRPALGNGAPGLAPPARAELGVPDGRRSAEARAKACEPLGAERDLRQQHQHLMARIECGGDGLEIDLRLAGAGHAVEHGDREFPRGDGGPQRLGGARLRGGQDRAGAVRVGTIEGCHLAHRDRLQRAHGSQSAHHTGAHAGLALDFGRGARRPVLQHGDHAGPRFGHARRLTLPQPVGGADRRRLERAGHAHRHAQDGTPLRQRVVGDPID